MFASVSTGRAGVTSQQDAIIVGRTWKPDSTKRGCIACHFAGGSALSFVSGTATDKPAAIADAGIPLLSGDEDGSPADIGYAFGNNLSMTTIGTLATYLQAPATLTAGGGLNGLGAKTDKLLLFGESMGGQLALNYARANPTKVAAIAAIVPALDLQYVHDNNVAGNAARIATSAGGAANLTAAYYSTHSPIAYASQLAGIPVKIWYNQNDPITPEATVRTFAGLVGSSCQIVNMGIVATGVPAGHDPNPAGGVDVANFLATYR